MGTLNENPVWEAGVRHFEANAVLTGGPGCPDNLPLADLANRTAWLKQQVETAQGGLAGHEAAADPHPQYLTSAEGDAKVAAHVAAADPHPVYWNNVRGDSKIAAAIAALVNSSPATLDTLAELATALGNDPNFATTITNSLAAKATQAGVQGQTYTAFTTTGATGAFVLTPNPSIAAYAAGQRFRVKFHTGGNGTDSLNVSDLGVKNIKQYDSTGVKVAAVIAANQLADVEYDGLDMVILDPLVPAPVAPGTVLFLAQNALPSGYLKANGAAISRTTYSALFSAIGTVYGAGDGSTTFNLPDLRGKFIRGFDDGRGVDSGRSIGSSQVSTTIDSRTINTSLSGNQGEISPAVYNHDTFTALASAPFQVSTAFSTSQAASRYTIRPRNVALLACIKF